jgi:hypothetical protein
MFSNVLYKGKKFILILEKTSKNVSQNFQGVKKNLGGKEKTSYLI